MWIRDLNERMNSAGAFTLYLTLSPDPEKKREVKNYRDKGVNKKEDQKYVLSLSWYVDTHSWVGNWS